MNISLWVVQVVLAFAFLAHGLLFLFPPEAVRKIKKHSPLPEASSERLLRIYGARAPQMLSLISADPALAAAFSPSTGATGAEILFAFRHELAETLVDCLWRRTLVGLSSDDAMRDANAASRIAQHHLGWNAERTAHELAACREYLARFKANV